MTYLGPHVRLRHPCSSQLREAEAHLSATKHAANSARKLLLRRRLLAEPGAPSDGRQADRHAVVIGCHQRSLRPDGDREAAHDLAACTVRRSQSPAMASALTAKLGTN